MLGKNRLAWVAAEFFGTATVTAVVLSVSKSGVGFPYFIGIGVALAVGVLLLSLGSMRGVSFNPAVTIGLWTARQVGTLNAVLAIAAQMLGAAASWKVYEYLTDAPLRSVVTGEFDWRIFTAEAIGTFVLGLAVAAAIYYDYVGNRLAMTIGLGYFLGITLASVAANGLINPAVALGVQSWSIAYALAPVVGAILAVNLYALLFAPAGSASVVGLLTGGATASTRSKAAKPAAKKPAARKKTTARKSTARRR